jgi:transcriptional regulator with XRE-family HTH domain
VTTIGLLIDRCGLSQKEAATALGVSLASIESWTRGRRTVPPGVIGELRTLYRQIEAAADAAIAAIAAQPGADAIDLGYCVDDHEAQSLGWPVAAAQWASLGLVIARVDRPVHLVPRGSTPATAAAADVHDP